MINKSVLISVFYALTTCFLGCESVNDDDHDIFLKRVRAGEAYIGFFATEKTGVSDVDESYLEARRRFFLGVSRSKQEPFKLIENLVDSCERNSLLTEQCDEVESFFQTLKMELVYYTVNRNRWEATSSLFEYMEVFYNPFRMHTVLKYRTPEQYEKSTIKQKT